MSNVRCPPYDVHRTMSTVRCPTYDVHRTMSNARCPTYDVQRMMSNVRCPTHDVHHTMSTERCPPYTMSTVPCPSAMLILFGTSFGTFGTSGTFTTSLRSGTIVRAQHSTSLGSLAHPRSASKRDCMKLGALPEPDLRNHHFDPHGWT